MNAIERLKAEGLYREAGRLAYLYGQRLGSYGCHYGLRSTCEQAAREFDSGWWEAESKSLTIAESMNPIE